MKRELPLPTVNDVERISTLDDPVVRNLQITQCYHELAAGLAFWLPRGANWCTMATWASRQAGQSIRQEDLRRTLERLVRQSAEAAAATEALEAQAASIRGDHTESLAGAAMALREALSPAAAFDRVSQAVAQGNQKVFAEIGLEFARFLALFEDGPPARETVAAFCESLILGEPPDGQRYLRQAFSHYAEALATPGAEERAELIHLANLEIGFHEQTRLQPEILAAMDAPVYEPADLQRRLLQELFPDPGSRLRLALAALSGRAAALLEWRDRLADEAQRLGRQVITEHMMALELSRGRVLRLGRDVPGDYPPELQRLANAQLRALLEQFTADPDSRIDTGSEDWGNLPDRMHFIAGLFRAYHFDDSLFDAPFTPAQVIALKANQRPPDV